MDRLDRFLDESPVADRASLPTRIVLRELTLGSSAVRRMLESRSFTPVGGKVCELEVGGRRIAQGRIVRRRGSYFFKTASVVSAATKKANPHRVQRLSILAANVTDSASDTRCAAKAPGPLLRAAAAAAASGFPLPGFQEGNPFLLNMR
jgi:hypothetical protein